MIYSAGVFCNCIRAFSPTATKHKHASANRIFGHANFSSKGRNSRNHGIDTALFKETNQALSSDQETRFLNELDKKFCNLAKLAIEDHSIVSVIDTHEYSSKRVVAIFILYPMDG